MVRIFDCILDYKCQGVDLKQKMMEKKTATLFLSDKGGLQIWHSLELVCHGGNEFGRKKAVNSALLQGTMIPSPVPCLTENNDVINSSLSDAEVTVRELK